MIKIENVEVIGWGGGITMKGNGKGYRRTKNGRYEAY